MELRSRFNYDGDVRSRVTGLECKDVSRAVQSQKDEADINVIVRRFGITGVMPRNQRVPTYGDFSGVVDYQSAVNAVMAADESFMAMPADVRRRFSNDPQEFLAFAMDPANIEELREMGLAVPKVVEDTPPVAPVAPVVKV